MEVANYVRQTSPSLVSLFPFRRRQKTNEIPFRNSQLNKLHIHSKHCEQYDILTLQHLHQYYFPQNSIHSVPISFPLDEWAHKNFYKQNKVKIACDEMEKQPGAMGTNAGLALRLAQAIFAVGSVLFMCLDVSFFSYSFAPFCFLVTTMGLVTPWSLGLAIIDVILLLAKRPSNQPRVLSAVVLGDWVLSVLSLAVACSTASVADFLLASDNVYCRGNICLRYQLSAAVAFLTWVLISASLLFNLWLLPTL